MLREYDRLKRANIPTLLVKHTIDTRSGTDVIKTHSGIECNALQTHHLLDINVDTLKKYDYILIDEGQFFNDLFSFCWVNANMENKIIIVAALNSNFKGELFGSITNLLGCAKIKFLTAICKCGEAATMSKRLIKGDEKEISIGGKEKYDARCIHCFQQED